MKKKKKKWTTLLNTVFKAEKQLRRRRCPDCLQRYYKFSSHVDHKTGEWSEKWEGLRNRWWWCFLAKETTTTTVNSTHVYHIIIIINLSPANLCTHPHFHNHAQLQQVSNRSRRSTKNKNNDQNVLKCTENANDMNKDNNSGDKDAAAAFNQSTTTNCTPVLKKQKSTVECWWREGKDAAAAVVPSIHKQMWNIPKLRRGK